MRPDAFGIGHALDAVHAGFEFQLGESAAAADLGDYFLVAAHRTVACVRDFDFPALLGGVAFVHAKQIASEQRRLVAAGAGADFEDDIALVHRILWQQRKPQSLLERRAARLELGLFGFGDRAHLRIGCGIGDQAGQAVKLALRVAIGFDRLDDRRQLGKFPRQLDIGLRRQHGREIALQCRMPRNQRFEFLIR